MFELYAIQASFSFCAAKTINYKLNSLTLGTTLKKSFSLLKSPYISSFTFFFLMCLSDHFSFCLSLFLYTAISSPGGANLQCGHFCGKIIRPVLRTSQPSPEAISITCPPRVRQHISECYSAVKWFSLCTDKNVRKCTADIFLETQKQCNMFYQAFYSAPEETES